MSTEPEWAIHSKQVVLPEGIRESVVWIRGETIHQILAHPSQLPGHVPVTDLGPVALLPGIVDTHAHINEPGRTEWEGFETATAAAAAGGISSVVDMPLNSIPATTS